MDGAWSPERGSSADAIDYRPSRTAPTRARGLKLNMNGRLETQRGDGRRGRGRTDVANGGSRLEMPFGQSCVRAKRANAGGGQLELQMLTLTGHLLLQSKEEERKPLRLAVGYISSPSQVTTWENYAS